MNLLGLTVLMAEVSNAEAARLNAQPALMYRVPAKDPFQTLFYMLPAVEFPDGKRYLKQGLFAPMPLLSDLERTFAVGTALTGGPPHRSQRALLTHWAPTSGHDAQSLFGIRVQCSMLDDFHQPSVVDGIEESTDVRVEYPVHFLVNRAPLSRQATCRIRSSAFRRSGDRT